MASLLNRDAPITAISPTNTSATRTYRTRIEMRSVFFARHAIKSTVMRLFEACGVSYRSSWMTGKTRKPYLLPPRTTVNAAINTAVFFTSIKSTEAAAARNNLHFAHFVFFSYQSLTFLLKLLYFVIIYNTHNNSILFRLCAHIARTCAHTYSAQAAFFAGTKKRCRLCAASL